MSEQATILVVDDTELNRRLLNDLLNAKGYAVQTASSGAEALALIDENRPDMVLLDVVMPGMDGYEVCRRIRENAEAAMLPIVMITALDQGEERVRGLEAGAVVAYQAASRRAGACKSHPGRSRARTGRTTQSPVAAQALLLTATGGADRCRWRR